MVGLLDTVRRIGSIFRADEPLPFSDKRIIWLLPPLQAGSGGLQTIFRHMEHLRRQGATNEIHLIGDFSGISREECAKIISGYGCQEAEIFLEPRPDRPCDYVIATMNTTAQFALEYQTENRFYFVQDYEPWFYPMGDERLTAEATYALGLNTITIGRWIASSLSRQHGHACAITDFCVDLDTYFVDPDVVRERAVCAVFQPEKPRRCSKLLIDALKVFHELCPDVEVRVFGSRKADAAEIPFAKSLGMLSLDECRRLYGSCMAGLCISSSNPSRMPFEMMACGLPVVDLHRENNLYDFADGTALLAAPDAASVASALQQIIEDDSLRSSLSARGLDFVSGRIMGRELEAFEAALLDFSSATSVGEDVTRSYTQPPIVANPTLAAQARRMQLDAEEERRRSQLPLHGKVRITVGIQSGREVPGDLRVYAWGDPEQKDLECLPLERGDGGAWEAVCDLSNHAGISGNYQFHVYGVVDGNDACLGIAERVCRGPEAEASSSAASQQDESPDEPGAVSIVIESAE